MSNEDGHCIRPIESDPSIRSNESDPSMISNEGDPSTISTEGTIRIWTSLSYNNAITCNNNNAEEFVKVVWNRDELCTTRLSC